MNDVNASLDFSVRRERHTTSVGGKPTRQLPLQPVAIGAVATSNGAVEASDGRVS